jgi:predicted RNA-binding Zn-ribbon protein involved in translation (DUF1610 family)
MKNKYACPVCGKELIMTVTKDFAVDVKTGETYLPTTSTYLYCIECEWDEHNDDKNIKDDILNKNTNL